MTGYIRICRYRRRWLSKLAQPGLPGSSCVASRKRKGISKFSRYSAFNQNRACSLITCVKGPAMDLKKPTILPKAYEDLQSKRACLSVCEAVQHRLPRELRDMILGYLLLEDGVHARLFHYYNTLDPKAPRHYWSKDFTGEATLRELTESWYRSVRFDFDRSLNFLPHLLAQVDTTLHCTRQELIGKASFKILQCDLDVWPAADASGILSPRDLLLKNMENLFKLRHSAKIYVILESPLPWFSESKNLQERQLGFLAQVLDVIFPTLMRLQQAGYALAVAVDPGSNVRFLDGQQIWRYELNNLITPTNAHFSPEGFVDRFRKVRCRSIGNVRSELRQTRTRAGSSGTEALPG